MYTNRLKPQLQPKLRTKHFLTMSDTANIDIDYIANLSRLTLTDEEKTLFASQLGDILGHFEKLNAIDVSNEEPMAHPFPFSMSSGRISPPSPTPRMSLWPMRPSNGITSWSSPRSSTTRNLVYRKSKISISKS